MGAGAGFLAAVLVVWAGVFAAGLGAVAVWASNAGARRKVKSEIRGTSSA